MAAKWNNSRIEIGQGFLQQQEAEMETQDRIQGEGGVATSYQDLRYSLASKYCNSYRNKQ